VIRPEDLDALQAALDAEKGARTALQYLIAVGGLGSPVIEAAKSVRAGLALKVVAVARDFIAMADAP
jgi:hypothetical protein